MCARGEDEVGGGRGSGKLVGTMGRRPRFQLASGFAFHAVRGMRRTVLLHRGGRREGVLLTAVTTSLFLVVDNDVNLCVCFKGRVGRAVCRTFLTNDRILGVRVPLVCLLFVVAVPLFVIFSQ